MVRSSLSCTFVLAASCLALACQSGSGDPTGSSASETGTDTDATTGTDTSDPTTAGPTGPTTDSDTTPTGSETDATDSSGSETMNPTDATTDPSETDATTDPTDATTDPTDATTDPTDATTDDPTDNMTDPTDATTDPSDTEMTVDPTTDTDTDTDTDTGMDTMGVDDDDMDGIPNDDDPFPDDPDLPGAALPFKVYAHSSSRLYTMAVEEPYEIAEVGPFSFDQQAGSVTDIAIDRWGVLYAITFNDLFVCNPSNAACYFLGDLPPGSTNGLTLVPPGVIDMDDDTLIAVANNGNWYRVDVVGMQAMFTQIGQYGMGYQSSGDAYSIEGVGTYGAVNGPGNADLIVEVEPSTGMALQTISQTDGYASIYGLAGWQGAIFAFNASGHVLKIDPDLGDVEVLTNAGISWWGAGVRTVLPQ